MRSVGRVSFNSCWAGQGDGRNKTHGQKYSTSAKGIAHLTRSHNILGVVIYLSWGLGVPNHLDIFFF